MIYDPALSVTQRRDLHLAIDLLLDDLIRYGDRCDRHRDAARRASFRLLDALDRLVQECRAHTLPQRRATPSRPDEDALGPFRAMFAAAPVAAVLWVVLGAVVYWAAGR
jgi:hypothetical protein